MHPPARPHDIAPPATCPNCGVTLSVDPAPHYCPACGQQTALHAPSFGEFLHEFVSHYVAIDGPLWRSLLALLFLPGKLTLEYLAGRRRRYVPPLRLYLSVSFAFFVLIKVLGAGSNFELEVSPGSDAASQAEAQRLHHCVKVPGSCGRVETWFAQAVARLMEGAPQAALQQRLAGAAPYAVFLMVPLFAAIVQLAYRRRRLAYGAHFVFGLHMHAFWFVAMLALAMLPEAATILAIPLVFGHGALALRRVYDGRMGATWLRSLFITTAYASAVLLSSFVLLLASLLWH